MDLILLIWVFCHNLYISIQESFGCKLVKIHLGVIELSYCQFHVMCFFLEIADAKMRNGPFA